MSSLKRKDATAKPTADSRPSKKVRSDKPTPKLADKKGSKATEKAPSSAPAVAILKDEEPLFPRGGGSVLTPLEHKQITIEAKRDALFEEESTKPVKKSEKGTQKKKKKSSAKEEKGAGKSSRDEDAVRIESLNYKVCFSHRDNCCPFGSD